MGCEILPVLGLGRNEITLWEQFQLFSYFCFQQKGLFLIRGGVSKCAFVHLCLEMLK